MVVQKFKFDFSEIKRLELNFAIMGFEIPIARAWVE
jgi:hypothetical protein